MNFLAHSFLSGNNPGILVGNFMGDFVKGRQYANFPADVASGVLLHREIDYFTDNHPGVEQSKIRLRPRFGHFAPVVVDIFYDHLLVRNWQIYSKEDIGGFVDNVYDVIGMYFDLLPPRLQAVFPNMKRNNWLLHYGYIEGVRRALAGMSRRSRFNPGLERAVDDLCDNYQEFADDFNGFFPDVIQFSRDFLSKL
jgi:acyl carrier protein phosphodiesterase